MRVIARQGHLGKGILGKNHLQMGTAQGSRACQQWTAVCAVLSIQWGEEASSRLVSLHCDSRGTATCVCVCACTRPCMGVCVCVYNMSFYKYL